MATLAVREALVTRVATVVTKEEVLAEATEEEEETGVPTKEEVSVVDMVVFRMVVDLEVAAKEEVEAVVLAINITRAVLVSVVVDF